MDLTHDLRVLLRKLEERTVPQHDVIVGSRLLRGEAEVSHQLGESLRRFFNLGALCAESGAPGSPGVCGPRGGMRMGGQVGQQQLGEQPVVPRSAGIHPWYGPKQLRRPARSGGRRLDPLHLTTLDQPAEMEANRIRMDAEPLGDLGDPQRTSCSPELGEHLVRGMLSAGTGTLHASGLYTAATCDNSHISDPL